MPTKRIAPAVALLALLALVLLPGTAAAHAELVVLEPGRPGGPHRPAAEITGDFSEEVDPTRSVMELRGPDGAPLATGGVPTGGPPTRMAIAGLPTLAPGVYEVRWTTVTADDDGVERGTFTFTGRDACPERDARPERDADLEHGPGSDGRSRNIAVARACSARPASATSWSRSSCSAPSSSAGAAVFLRRRR